MLEQGRHDMIQMIADALREAWIHFSDGFAAFLPRLIAMLVIVVVGWLIAAVVAFVLRTLLSLFRFNALADRTGTSEILKRADLPPADRLAAGTVFWILWIGFLASGVGALGLAGMEQLTGEFFHFVPRVFVALAVLVAGFVLANFAWRATLLTAVNANIPSARLLSGGVRFLVSLLAVAMALEQLGIAQHVVVTAFAIAFGAVMLGLAVAFGIGGGGVARRIVEQQFPEKPKRSEDDVSHL
jgi:hypothetical protein